MSTTTKPQTLTAAVKYADLPVEVKEILRRWKMRPATVTVELTSAPVATANSGLMSGNLDGLGVHVEGKTEHWQGSDGESNWSTEHHYSVAALSQSSGWSSKKRAHLTIVGLWDLGELSETDISELKIGFVALMRKCLQIAKARTLGETIKLGEGNSAHALARMEARHGAANAIATVLAANEAAASALDAQGDAMEFAISNMGVA